MIDSLLNYAFGYLGPLSLWHYVVITLVLAQITIFGVTLYLHRHQSHRAIDMHPVLSHFFRLWLWLTTGMNTKEWVAVHRKHHAKSETVDDPHSPLVYGIKTVLLEGAELYRQAKFKDPDLLTRYGKGAPDDWLERNVYTAHSIAGVVITLLSNVLLFGVPGITIWAIQMMWIPIFAAGGINGIGHYFGYRNFSTQDTSRNIYPWAFFIGGEELHNNHHTYGNSAKFSVHWWEFDIGWLMISLLKPLGLITVNNTPPQLACTTGKNMIDHDTIKAFMRGRFQVLANYTKQVMMPIIKDEQRNASDTHKELLETTSKQLLSKTAIFDQQIKTSIEQNIQSFAHLNVAYQLQEQLKSMWQHTAGSQKELIDKLSSWCHAAENSGIKVLADFSMHLKNYVLAG